jgi:hypothetical protein
MGGCSQRDEEDPTKEEIQEREALRNKEKEAILAEVSKFLDKSQIGMDIKISCVAGPRMYSKNFEVRESSAKPFSVSPPLE